MINKTLFGIAILAITSSCLAAEPYNRFYVGADAQGIRLKPAAFENQSKDRWGFSGFGGYRWSNIGLEFGVTGIQSEHYNASGNGLVYNGDSKAFNIYLDAQFMKSIASKLEIKGLVGAGALCTKTSLAGYAQGNNLSFSTEETAANIGLRLGAGLQYNFTNHFNTSLMYKYQLTSDTFNNMQAVALSLAYLF